jgi:hypothetical protein
VYIYLLQHVLTYVQVNNNIIIPVYHVGYHRTLLITVRGCFSYNTTDFALLDFTSQISYPIVSVIA